MILLNLLLLYILFKIYNIYIYVLLLASWTVPSIKPWTKDGALLLATSNGSSFAVPPIPLEADTNFENFSRNSWISTSLENISVVYGCLWWTGSRWREHIQLAKEPYFHKTKLAGSQAKQGLKYVWNHPRTPLPPNPASSVAHMFETKWGGSPTKSLDCPPKFGHGFTLSELAKRLLWLKVWHL